MARRKTLILLPQITSKNSTSGLAPTLSSSHQLSKETGRSSIGGGGGGGGGMRTRINIIIYIGIQPWE
jgi:hypothetical protein